MTLLVFLLAYLIRRRLDAGGHWQSERVWAGWFRLVLVVLPDRVGRWAGVLVAAALPALLALWITGGLAHRGIWLLWVPFEVLVLVMLMGAPGWRAPLGSYVEAWTRGDMQAAWHHVRDRLPADERGSALSPDAMHRSLCRVYLDSMFSRFFLVAFWYVVAGLPGAVMARTLAGQWPERGRRDALRWPLQLAGWLPLRLLCLTFGLAGDLSGWLRTADRRWLGLRTSAGDLLMRAANGALTGYALDPARFQKLHPTEWADFGGRSVAAIRDLLNRSMLIWLCLLALLVIAGLI
ncbi:histidine kinase [Marinobacter sp. C2H3]|uniref:histidine kinase n=1 Tax=Marinobacter sp. C2H3 TaxID=3119003 RepID=UPI00300E90E4